MTDEHKPPDEVYSLLNDLRDLMVKAGYCSPVFMLVKKAENDEYRYPCVDQSLRGEPEIVAEYVVRLYTAYCIDNNVDPKDAAGYLQKAFFDDVEPDEPPPPLSS